MKKQMFLIVLFVTSTVVLHAQQWNGSTTASGDITRTGNVGIGITSNPSSYLEVKSKIDMGSTSSTFVSPYYIGTCNDYGAGAAQQYLLLTPYVSMATGNPSAGLSGVLSFYRGNTSSGNWNAEYTVRLQTAWSSSNFDLSPLTSGTTVVNIYKVDYSGVTYIALKPSEVLNTSTAINFMGHYWNNVNSQKPQLVLASAVTNALVLKDYALIAGNVFYEDVNKNIGIGTTDPQSKLQIGNFANANTNALVIPGNYNFEQIKLAQLGNGNSGLEFVNHSSTSTSYGIKFLVNVDQVPGLQIQYAPSTNAYGSLSYTTGLFMDLSGNVGINTTNTKGYKFAVNGSGIFTKVIVKPYANWPDYVFEPTYELPSLDSLEAFIKTNKHLPSVPSAKEIEKNGVDLGQNQSVLLQKAEELTLYMIEQNKKLDQQQSLIELLQSQLEKQKAELDELKKKID